MNTSPAIRILGSARRWAAQCASALSSYAARRRAAAELQRLDDRLLGDIGLTRYSIQAISSGGALQPRAGNSGSERVQRPPAPAAAPARERPEVTQASATSLAEAESAVEKAA